MAHLLHYAGTPVEEWGWQGFSWQSTQYSLLQGVENQISGPPVSDPGKFKMVESCSRQWRLMPGSGVGVGLWGGEVQPIETGERIVVSGETTLKVNQTSQL